MDRGIMEGGTSHNLEGRFYADPDIYRLEQERIFGRDWQLVGAASLVAQPGQYVATTIAGHQVFVQRGDDGVVRAFRNMCPHRGAQILPEGSGLCGTLRCPYHGWLFTSAGQVRDTPWYDEPTPFDLSSLRLSSIAVAEWRALVFLALDPVRSLEDQLADLPAEAAHVPMESFTLDSRRTFAADVNWKAYLDQFHEFYHVPVVHGPDKAVGMQHYDVYPRRGMMRMTSPAGAASDAAYYGGRWLWGWPNWTLSFFPGGMKTSRVDPLSATRCEVDFGFYFADMSEAAAPFRSQVVEATSSIFLEDVGAASLVQTNYNSGAYRPGPLHPKLERATAYFQARVRQALGDDNVKADTLLNRTDAV